MDDTLVVWEYNRSEERNKGIAEEENIGKLAIKTSDLSVVKREMEKIEDEQNQEQEREIKDRRNVSEQIEKGEGSIIEDENETNLERQVIDEVNRIMENENHTENEIVIKRKKRGRGRRGRKKNKSR